MRDGHPYRAPPPEGTCGCPDGAAGRDTSRCRACAAPVCTACAVAHARERGGLCFRYWFAPHLAPQAPR